MWFFGILLLTKQNNYHTKYNLTGRKIFYNHILGSLSKWQVHSWHTLTLQNMWINDCFENIIQPYTQSGMKSGYCVRWESAPSRNLRNMTPNLQGFTGQCTLGSLIPRLLGQCSLGSPALFPFPDTIWPATCSPISTDPSPLLSSPIYWFPMWPTLTPFLSVYSWVFLTGSSVWSSIRPFKRLDCSCSESHKKYGIICCTAPGLTEALYIHLITCETCKM
jgi:hypothetical protein